ncbi:hypothetical protein CPC16_000103 [Podila verticillata]|nr:hypothetical protein BGZ52_009920 [Haplosporangium bisporale]KAF9207189.1 hypothetical protein BGZ59_011308 [Podila verticillata]KAF9376620.1 hypothetical protein CPC16_000103 [Podila verticillata]KAI9242275.1 MAG: hypothetical protein BYD32DRAFT_457103 [Podila humilis]KFH72156.1 hypothetical protein MVEG_02448 [Podila verticillata NRRL 6337]
MTQTYTNNNNRNSTISFESNMTRPSIQLSEHSDSDRTSRSQEPRLITSGVPEQKLSPFARRGSLAAIADKFRTRSSSRSPSQHRKSVDSSVSRSSFDSTSSRRSSSSEATGAYADVVKAQELHMQKLRAKQHILHITHNADGLPLPPYPGTEKSERRRSLVQILGMDKPLLAR